MAIISGAQFPRLIEKRIRKEYGKYAKKLNKLDKSNIVGVKKTESIKLS